MATSLIGIAKRVLAAALVVAGSTALSVASDANAVTAGFLFLLSVLGLSVWRGFFAGMVGSLLATACFNYFFFPPIGTLRIADPENWVSLTCFLTAATIASRLVLRARERASEAELRLTEITAMYELCVDLFAAGTSPRGLDAATSRALRTLGARYGGLTLHPGEAGGAGAGEWVGSPADFEAHQLLQKHPDAVTGAMPGDWRNVRVPVTVGTRTVGELVAYGTRASQPTLDSVAKLLALALERERLLAERARLAALESSDALKTALLRAVSHDLATPLTAVLVSLQSLRRELGDRIGAREAVELIESETRKLHRRIQNLLDMARLEAGGARPQRETTPAADLFRMVRENLVHLAATPPIEWRVAEDCPDLDVDPSLALEILVNLVENAHRASPAHASVEVAARPRADAPRRVVLEVLDRGPGLGPAPTDGRFEGDAPRKGLGLEIARRFAAAMDGELSLCLRSGGGVAARVELAAAGASGRTSAEGR